jgi:4-hydroxybenzoyl-CoA thioesterase
MLTNQRTISIEWGDCDAAGIVFFPRYFAWFDGSTHALFARAGFEKRAMLDTFGIVGIPVVDARARFLQPSSFGDIVTIQTRVTRFGRSSFDVQHQLLRGQALAVEGFETRVWAVRVPGEAYAIRSQKIPDDVKRRLTDA